MSSEAHELKVNQNINIGFFKPHSFDQQIVGLQISMVYAFYFSAALIPSRYNKQLQSKTERYALSPAVVMTGSGTTAITSLLSLD